MSDADDRFFRTITKQAEAPFDAVAFFRGASFYAAAAADSGPSKLADDGMSTPMTTPGVKPPKIEIPDAPGDAIDMHDQGKRPKKSPNNPSGFHGLSGNGDSGTGFNPIK